MEKKYALYLKVLTLKFQKSQIILLVMMKNNYYLKQKQKEFIVTQANRFITSIIFLRINLKNLLMIK